MSLGFIYLLLFFPSSFMMINIYVLFVIVIVTWNKLVKLSRSSCHPKSDITCWKWTCWKLNALSATAGTGVFGKTFWGDCLLVWLLFWNLLFSIVLVKRVKKTHKTGLINKKYKKNNRIKGHNKKHLFL